MPRPPPRQESSSVPRPPASAEGTEGTTNRASGVGPTGNLCRAEDVYPQTMPEDSPLPPPLPHRPQLRTGSAARAVWIVSGVAALLLVGVLLVLVAVVLVNRGAPARPAELARIVARPLVAEGAAEPQPTDAEMLATLALRMAEASSIADRGGDLGPVAREYADSLAALRRVLDEAPSAEPLVRAGIDTWRGGVEDDSEGVLLGLLSIGSELSKVSEFTDRVEVIHARIVACRLRVWELAARSALPESTADTVTGAFTEVGRLSTVASDTLAVRNVSGLRLTNVILVVELTGGANDRFTNVYFAERWEPDQILRAICRSESPGRETVRNVQLVRFRVMSDQRTSRLGEIKTGH